MTGIEKVLEAERDSPSAVAQKLTTDEMECTRQLVQYWRDQGYVTPKWAMRVSKIYGIPLHELNPTIYPKSFPKHVA